MGPLAALLLSLPVIIATSSCSFHSDFEEVFDAAMKDSFAINADEHAVPFDRSNWSSYAVVSDETSRVTVKYATKRGSSGSFEVSDDCPQP